MVILDIGLLFGATLYLYRGGASQWPLVLKYFRLTSTRAVNYVSGSHAATANRHEFWGRLQEKPVPEKLQNRKTHQA